VTRDELRQRIGAIEESYEFFLAFAAQGVRDDRESTSGSQLREFLEKMAVALSGLGPGLMALIERESSEPAEPWREFARVVANDAAAAHAAVALVSSRPAISSQLVDNLNASIHVRALLTDLFLLDEILK
jgi:hypothetical protein